MAKRSRNGILIEPQRNGYRVVRIKSARIASHVPVDAVEDCMVAVNLQQLLRIVRQFAVEDPQPEMLPPE